MDEPISPSMIKVILPSKVLISPLKHQSTFIKNKNNLTRATKMPIDIKVTDKTYRKNMVLEGYKKYNGARNMGATRLLINLPFFSIFHGFLSLIFTTYLGQSNHFISYRKQLVIVPIKVSKSWDKWLFARLPFWQSSEQALVWLFRGSEKVWWKITYAGGHSGNAFLRGPRKSGHEGMTNRQAETLLPTP